MKILLLNRTDFASQVLSVQVRSVMLLKLTPYYYAPWYIVLLMLIGQSVDQMGLIGRLVDQMVSSDYLKYHLS